MSEDQNRLEASCGCAEKTDHIPKHALLMQRLHQGQSKKTEKQTRETEGKECETKEE